MRKLSGRLLKNTRRGEQLLEVGELLVWPRPLSRRAARCRLFPLGLMSVESIADEEGVGCLALVWS